MDGPTSLSKTKSHVLASGSLYLSTVINTMFLPEIEFSNLYYDDTSEQTKQTFDKAQKHSTQQKTLDKTINTR